MICNHYQKGNRLGRHVDNSESSRALELGHPVASISLGASAIFEIGGPRKTDPVDKVRLSHGDVLFFGGSARLAFHGITRVEDDYYSRINFTLRKY